MDPQHLSPATEVAATQTQSRPSPTTELDSQSAKADFAPLVGATSVSGKTPGTVYLVGAGPGDPGLLTLRGAECLRRADAVIYDRLAHPSHLRHARPGAEMHYVGKASARHTLTQPEINALIVELALQGKTVCRLKGGDPFVFGRGGEEAQECLNAGVPFEIVPGVTSAIAAPAYAGIPVTHRDAASSFAVITGHERDDAGEGGTREGGVAEQRRNWAHIAHAADTLVFLMGVENLGEISEQLQRHGRAADTPVALVRWGTWPRQEVLTSTLSEVAAEVKRRAFKAPAVTIVGEVVRLRETLRWFDDRPLFGKRVLVTRAREQASALTDLLREQGADPVEFPVIRIEPMGDYSALDAALTALSQCPTPSAQRPYGWCIFTSANGVDAVARRLAALRLDARAFAGCKLAAIGPATAEALAEMGLRADFVPSQFVAEKVIEEWPDTQMAGVRVLLPRAEEAREILPEKLREMGAEVDAIPVYRTLMDATAAEEIRAMFEAHEIDAVTFTSSSTVRYFVESIGPGSLPDLLTGTTIASIGPITSATAKELGLGPHVEASEHTIPGLVNDLTCYLQRGDRFLQTGE